MPRMRSVVQLIESIEDAVFAELPGVSGAVEAGEDFHRESVFGVDDESSLWPEFDCSAESRFNDVAANAFVFSGDLINTFVAKVFCHFSVLVFDSEWRAIIIQFPIQVLLPHPCHSPSLVRVVVEILRHSKSKLVLPQTN